MDWFAVCRSRCRLRANPEPERAGGHDPAAIASADAPEERQLAAQLGAAVTQRELTDADQLHHPPRGGSQEVAARPEHPHRLPLGRQLDAEQALEELRLRR